MNQIVKAIGKMSAALAAGAIVLALYAFARLPNLSDSVRGELASRFQFTRSTLETKSDRPFQEQREVHPSLQRISAWMSTLGAAVALGDLDGDGLPNDVCRVEPRTNEVIVQAAPGTGPRYESFVLNPQPLQYDERTMAPMGCLLADLNEDGLMDALVYYWGRTPIAFLRKKGIPGTRSLISAGDFVRTEVVSEPERWYTNAVTMADVDGDGHIDIVLGNYFQDGARILDSTATGTEVMHDTKSKSFNGGHKHLLLFESATAAPAPSVRFREAHGVFEREVDQGWLLAVGAADLDGDLLPEIYFAHDFGPDRLMHNRSRPGVPQFASLKGHRGFTTPASLVLGRDSFKGMGVDFGDLNGDGIPDIYVSNIADEYALQESHFLWLSTGDVRSMKSGQAPYVHGAEKLGLSRSGWGWDTKLADLNNDGDLEALQATGFVRGSINRWPELQALGTGNDDLMTNPHNWPPFRQGADLSGHDRFAFFTRDRTGRFQNIGPSVGFTIPMVSRGIAIADVDGDGRLDFAVANQWEDSFFYHNDSSRAGAFLGLHLLLPLNRGVATRSAPGHPDLALHGRPAIGATARLVLPDGRKMVGQVDGGNGHSGRRSPDLHFGLGGLPATAEALPVELKWRDPAGVVHDGKIQLRPGWYTVVLGWPEAN